jgi:hypothetical protein
VAGIVTRLQTGRRRVQISKGARDFVLYKPSKPALTPTQSFYSVGTGVLCPGVKRPGRDVYQSPPSSAQRLRMSEAVFLLSLYVFMARTRTPLL